MDDGKDGFGSHSSRMCLIHLGNKRLRRDGRLQFLNFGIAFVSPAYLEKIMLGSIDYG